MNPPTAFLEKNGALFAAEGALSFIAKHKNAMFVDMHEITRRSRPLSEAQMHGHAAKLVSKYTLSPLVLRPKEMFKTPSTIELVQCVTQLAPPRWMRCISLEVVLPFAGKIEYPTLSPSSQWFGATPKGTVRGHTLVHKVDTEVDKCVYSGVNAQITNWIKLVEEATVALNADIDAFNTHLVQFSMNMLRKHSLEIEQAMQELDRLPYPTKTA